MIAIPVELLEQFERGNVLLFIGEQMLSDAAGRTILDQMIGELAARAKTDNADELDFPAAAQLYEDQAGRQALVQFVRERLEALDHQPQPVHRLIAQLTGCHVIVTTCVDRRLEQAFADAGRPLDVIIGNVDVAFEAEEKTRLYKLRGSLARPESLVLTEDDYETFFEEQSSISVVLQGYLARKTILFVGYDLADPYFKRLYRKVMAPLDEYARRSYAFGAVLAPRIRRWCERHGIAVMQVSAATFLEDLSTQLAQRAPKATPPPPWPGPKPISLSAQPYKLLDYYETSDEAIFFGRQMETQTLCSLIHAHRLVVLYGASGAGKTSVLLAGVVPRLMRTEPPYQTICVRALDDPAQVIRRTVCRLLPAAELPADGSLVAFIDSATRALGCALVIILDQFEEFFIRLGIDARHAFISELGEVYDAHDVAVKIVLSLREDWLASIGEIEARIPTIFHMRLRLLPMDREQAHQAITCPVERLGMHYEPALVERLLDDLTQKGDTDVMPPQLQLVCSALFNTLAQDAHVITLTSYEQLGGTRGILLRYLDEELARFQGEERRMARTILEALVTSHQTKRLLTQPELERATHAQVQTVAPVVEKLLRARLLRLVRSSVLDESTYELSHEYLIEQISISPEVRARKEAQELLDQGMQNWKSYGTLIAEDALEIINNQRRSIQFTPDEEMLVERSARRLARRTDIIVRGFVGGLVGGVWGGLIAQLLASHVLASPMEGPEGNIQALGAAIVFALIGSLIGLAYGVSRSLNEKRMATWIGTVTIAGIVISILLSSQSGWNRDLNESSAPIAMVIMMPCGLLYAVGIVGAVKIGKRQLAPSRRVGAWLAFGGVAGLGSAVLNALLRIVIVEGSRIDSWHLTIPAITAATIAVGIGLTVEGLRSKVVRGPATFEAGKGVMTR